MTNSMIPYSFIPGTKAKAGEVNANFIALANIIEQNKGIALENVLEVKELMKEKADKTELIVNHTVSISETDLNDYKTFGIYVFSTLYTPVNIPKGESGTLIVVGTEDAGIKQIWYCDGVNGEIFTRNYQNSAWGAWNSNSGILNKEKSGYLKMQNGLTIQWGIGSTSKTITYPIAFSSLVCPVALKNGCGTDYTRSDMGFTSEKLTGFTYNTAGKFSALNWIAIGY